MLAAYLRYSRFFVRILLLVRHSVLLPRVLFTVLALLSFTVYAAEPWIKPGTDGQPQVQLYFFWGQSCPHCIAAHPHVSAIPEARPWVTLHELEVSRDSENARRFRELVEADAAGRRAGVPAFMFCGEMHFGWDSDETTGTSRLAPELNPSPPSFRGIRKGRGWYDARCLGRSGSA